MKKKIAVLSLVFSVLLSIRAFAVQAPEITAQGAIVADPISGQVIYEKNADEKMFPASTTKVMTALLALEMGDLDEQITVSKQAVDGLYEQGSPVNLIAGETLTLEQLVRYLLVASGNDAANVIAEHFAGSNQAFAEVMNQRAEELGCKNTNFVNPHGLHDQNHYTCARDLYLITQCAMQNEFFAQTVAMQQYTLEPNEVCKEKRLFYTTNHLISRWKNVNYIYKKAIGIKTGSTTPAGHCLIAGAKSGEQTYYSVVLNCPIDEKTNKIMSFVDSTNLLEWAFDNFETREVLSANLPIKEVEVQAAKDKDFVVLEPQDSVSILMPKDAEEQEIIRDIKTYDKIVAPIEKGQVLGEVSVSYNGQTFATVPLVASNSVGRSTVLYVFSVIGGLFKSLAFKIIFAVIISAVVIYVIYVIMINRGKGKKYYNYRKFNNRRR